MSKVLNLAFQTSKLENSFSTMIRRNLKPMHGLMFLDIDHIMPMHYKRHERVFGHSSFGVITNYLIAPEEGANPAYLGAMMRETFANSLSFVYPWSYAPDYGWTLIRTEQECWWQHFKQYSWAAGIHVHWWMKNELRLELHRSDDGIKWEHGGYHSWRYLRYQLKCARKEGIPV